MNQITPTHPFFAGTYDGHHLAHCGVEDRLRIVAKADAATCQAVLALPGDEVQKTVRQAAERRLRKLMKTKVAL